MKAASPTIGTFAVFVIGLLANANNEQSDRNRWAGNPLAGKVVIWIAVGISDNSRSIVRWLVGRLNE